MCEIRSVTRTQNVSLSFPPSPTVFDRIRVKLSSHIEFRPFLRNWYVAAWAKLAYCIQIGCGLLALWQNLMNSRDLVFYIDS